MKVLIAMQQVVVLTGLLRRLLLRRIVLTLRGLLVERVNRVAGPLALKKADARSSPVVESDVPA